MFTCEREGRDVYSVIKKIIDSSCCCLDTGNWAETPVIITGL
jgi:hypothetical protein